MLIKGALLKLIVTALSVRAVISQTNPDSNEGNTGGNNRNNDGFMRNLLRGMNLQRVQPNDVPVTSGLPSIRFNEPVPRNREPTILSEDPLAVLSNGGRFDSGSTNTQPHVNSNSSQRIPTVGTTGNLPPFQSSGSSDSAGGSNINVWNNGAPDLSEFGPIDPSFNDLEIDPDSSVLGPADLKPVDHGNQITRRPGRRRRRRTTTTTTTTTTPRPPPPQKEGNQQSDAIARTTSIIGGLLGSMLNGGRGVDPLTGALLQAMSPGAAAATNPTQTLLGVLLPHNQNSQHNPDPRRNSNSNDVLNNITGQLLSGLTGGTTLGMRGISPQQPIIFAQPIGMQPFGQPMQPFGRPMFGPVRHQQFPIFG